jgi:beta-glucosidase
MQASTRALNAGMDMAMAGKSATETLELAVAMESAVTGGRVPVSRINQAVRRVLQLKDRIGVFERPNGFKNNMFVTNSPVFLVTLAYTGFRGAIATAASRRVVKQATLESITLLKNNNSLPIVLQEGNRKIIVAGPTSNSIRRQCGAWLDTWRGLENSAAQHNPTTLVAGIREVVKAYKWNVEHYEGSGINNGDGSSWPAINSAKDADYIIVAVGEDPHPEGVDPISDLTLPGPQMEFARQIADAAKQAYRILVVISGRPRTFEQLIPKYDAILYAYLPCYDGGSAIAEVLVGQHPPYVDHCVRR